MPDLRGFGMVSLIPALGYRCRYPAQEHKLVRRFKLSPVRVHDAGAIKVDFDPKNEEPFSYTTPEGETVSTELGDTPVEYVSSIAQFIHDAIDGHPLIRPLRRLHSQLTKTTTEVEIEIPPTNVYSGSTWFCSMSGDTARFDQTSSVKPLANAG